MSAVEERARPLLVKVLELDSSGGDIRREDTPAWDSLKHIDLIFLLEDEFGVVLSEEEMHKLDSLSAIVSLLESHHAA